MAKGTSKLQKASEQDVALPQLDVQDVLQDLNRNVNVITSTTSTPYQLCLGFPLLAEPT